MIASERVNWNDEENKILDFWQKIDAFKKQLDLTKNKKMFTFYDGPPFATGLPHYGNLVAGTIKVKFHSLLSKSLFYKLKLKNLKNSSLH